MSQPLLDIYHAFDDTLKVVPAPEDGTLKSLVTFDDTRSEPVHGWYTFKEGYSLVITDDNDFLRKVDYLEDTIIKPYWTANFADSPRTPSLTAYGVDAVYNRYPTDQLRPSALSFLQQRGF